MIDGSVEPKAMVRKCIDQSRKEDLQHHNVPSSHAISCAEGARFGEEVGLHIRAMFTLVLLPEYRMQEDLQATELTAALFLTIDVQQRFVGTTKLHAPLTPRA